MYERTFSGTLGPYFAQIKPIGVGGNGRVYSAVDTRYDFPVCIKRISVANKDECRAALREIRIRRRLRHENLVGLVNCIVSDGTDVSDITPVNFRDRSCMFLIQELLDADLRQVIESYTRLSDDYVILFFYQLLRGLKYIHSANILHCDLKPSNILVNINSLQLKIGDFGHSIVLDPEYVHGSSVAVCATSLWYKAPEIILGSRNFSTASDIWAAGCILAEMLLGRPLFEGENELEQLETIIHAIEVNQKDQIAVREYLTEEANKMYSGRPKFPLHAKLQKVDFQALHLLEHLLSFNPDERVTSELALSHPFFQEYACVADEPVCTKPLHLEHEVDDFLEYTLKDLIVGECVALAQEQPYIHMQMSSYPSSSDIGKESSGSPDESSSKSVEESQPAVDLKNMSENDEELAYESDSSRFKVLEVLKEEHGSSSDSNSFAAHGEGVSEEPLVLDHPMFSSSKWEKERYKSGHRRHHSHHRRKSSEESKSRRRKISPGNKVFKSPCSEIEASKIPAVRDSIAENEVCAESYSDKHLANECTLESNIPAYSSQENCQDDKVQELILRSRQLIAYHNEVSNVVPGVAELCELPLSKEHLQFPAKTHEEKLDEIMTQVEENQGSYCATGLVGSGHYDPAFDLGVVDVIHRSQELLGAHHCEQNFEKTVGVLQTRDPVKDLILRSEQLLGSQEANNFATTENCLRQMGTFVDYNVSGSKHVDSSYNYPSSFELSKQCKYHSPFTEANPSPSLEEKQTKTYSNYPPPFTENPITLQSIPSDPYHLKESNRRMQELFEESHGLLDSFKTAQEFKPGVDPTQGSPSSPDSRRDELCLGGDRFGCVKTCETNAFRGRLEDIDLNEMRGVLDQAKKLLAKSCELSETAGEKLSSVGDEAIDGPVAEDIRKNKGHEVSLLDRVVDASGKPCRLEEGTKALSLENDRPETFEEKRSVEEDQNGVEDYSQNVDLALKTPAVRNAEELQSAGEEKSALESGNNTDITNLSLSNRKILSTVGETIVDEDGLLDIESKPAMKTYEEFGTFRNGVSYSSKRPFDPDDLVNRLCGNACLLEKNTKAFNSKDGVGLQSFYKHLKLKSIIRNHPHARAHR